ncbi:prolyl-tRNA synthetase associated domain-containing protein [Jeotgalibaca sp. A127]|uniref:prolyl-tRNA synthetase associated domain-containing protein n=1 Tax=Jeotgalibaca sp. A127 TaxID=3457324 RepID=UPI003FD6867E
MSKAVFGLLEQLHIHYETIKHPPVFTTEEANRYIEGIEGVRTKSLFLTNKKKSAFYLVIMDDSKKLDMSKFQTTVQTNRVKMASPDRLMEKMKLEPGSVSIFGLINNTERDIQVYFDQAILTEQQMSFHPNINTQTIFLETQDVLKFIAWLGYSWKAIAL